MIDLEAAFAGLAPLARLLRAREVSPVELVESCLARIDAAAPRLGCFAAVAAERARREARAADAELAAGKVRGPLHGIPYALADVIDTDGVATGLGVAALAGRVPERDATIAARLVEQGAVLVAKAAVVPLGGALEDASAPAASCRTPWDPARWAGGPAPGAAAAVAAGLVPFALAVEGASPASAAAACGVTALRPTYGVLSRHGVVAGSYTLAAVAPVARSAEDCALVLGALAGADPRDPSSIPVPHGLARVAPELPAGVRIGLVEEPAPAAGDAWAETQELLRAAGAILEPAALPELPWEAIAAVLAGAEGTVIREDVVGLAAPPGAWAGGSGADVVRAARLRGEAQRALGRLLARHDLLLAPAPRAPASAADAPAPDRLGAAVALGGLPAVTLPIGLAPGGALGARLVAPPLEEARLLSTAALFQSRTQHHLRRPPPAAATPVAAVTRR